MEEKQRVIIVGAGPSGISAAACFTKQSIPYIILEREDCSASLWKKYSYERLHLHLRKQYCQLPHKPFPASFPPYVPKKQFLQYLDDYVSHFGITPLYRRTVELAEYDQGCHNWRVMALNGDSGQLEEYRGRFQGLSGFPLGFVLGRISKISMFLLLDRGILAWKSHWTLSTMVPKLPFSFIAQ